MTPINKLAQQVGFHASYKDCYGNNVEANQQALKALLEAMEYDLSSDEAILASAEELQNQKWLSLLPKMQLVKSELAIHSVTLSVTQEQLTQDVKLVN